MRAGGAPRAFVLHAWAVFIDTCQKPRPARPSVLSLDRLPRWVDRGPPGYSTRVHRRRKLLALLAAGAIGLGVSACGEDDVDKARKDVQEKADELKGDLDNLSKKDLQNKLDDVENAAENGSKDTKRKARELENKIERELDSRK
jgi:hypothetical protein